MHARLLYNGNLWHRGADSVTLAYLCTHMSGALSSKTEMKLMLMLIGQIFFWNLNLFLQKIISEVASFWHYIDITRQLYLVNYMDQYNRYFFFFCLCAL